MHVLLLAFLLCKAVCGLYFHGFVSDGEGGDVGVYTTEPSTAKDAISRYHASSDGDEPQLDRRGGIWQHCDQWNGGAIGGGGGCNSRHSPSKFYHRAGSNSTRVFIEEMVNATLGTQFPENRHRSHCLTTENKGKLCVSWAKPVRRGLDQQHVVHVTDFAMHCLDNYGYSSMIMTDTTTREWAWICISNRPKGCHGNICSHWRLAYANGRARPNSDFNEEVQTTTTDVHTALEDGAEYTEADGDKSDNSTGKVVGLDGWVYDDGDGKTPQVSGVPGN